MSDSSAFVEDRRCFERREVAVPVSVQGDAWPDAVACESIDVSVGGMRLRSSVPLPFGRCAVVIDASVALVADVLESVIDVRTGEVLSRLSFAETPPAAQRRLAALTGGQATAAVGSRRRRRPVVLVAVAAGLAAALTVAALTAGGGPSAGKVPVADSAPEPAPPTTAVAAEAPVAAPATPAPAEVAAPVVTPTTAAPAPVAPAGPPAQSDVAAAPAAVTRQEPSDHAVRVVLAREGEQSSVASTVGPGDGVDPVRVQLQVSPEPRGTVFDFYVSVENRTDAALEVGDVVVTAARDGAVVATVTLPVEATSVAPGETVFVDGAIDLGAPGEYDLTATAEVTG